MSLQKNVSFHGIILYRQNYREKDMLVKFLTAEYGIKMFLIRRGRSANFKLRADILTFTYGEYVGSISDDGLSYLNSVIETHHYLNISNDIKLNAYATYIMSLIDASLPEGSVNKGWFKQIYYALKLINAGFDPEVITDICELQMLSLFGVKPILNGCIICHRSDLPLDYSANYGGLLCSNHWHLDPRRFHLDRRSVYYLRLFSRVDLSMVNNIKVNSITKAHLRQLLDSVYSDSVGIHLKSKKFLDQINLL